MKNSTLQSPFGNSLRALGVSAGFLAAAAMLSPVPVLAAAGTDVKISGSAVSAGDLVGKTVTMSGERIGKITDLIGRENTYNDVIIRLDKEHSQMGVVLGRDWGAMPGHERPVIVGGTTVAVPAEALTAGTGGALALSKSAITSLDQFRDRGGQDYYFYTERR